MLAVDVSAWSSFSSSQISRQLISIYVLQENLLPVTFNKLKVYLHLTEVNANVIHFFDDCLELIDVNSTLNFQRTLLKATSLSLSSSVKGSL